MSKRKWAEENRQSWNAATRRHNSHKGDQAAFLRDGGSTLFPEEVELLGDIRGKNLLHLQCNAGQDTLSIATHLGASVTGVDISDEAISFAQRLSHESGIPGTFIRSDVYDWFQSNDQLFDVVFASYGAIVWLPDLNAWGKGIAAALRPGGRFVLIEFHPMLGVLDGALTGDWSEAGDYMGGRRYRYDQGIGDYVGEQGGAHTASGVPIEAGEPFVNPNPCHEFYWGLADVVSALLDAGLSLTALREYPYSNGFSPYPDLIELPGRRMAFQPDIPKIPRMFAVCAHK